MSTLNRTFSVKNGIDVANTIIVDSNRNISNVANLTANFANIASNTTTSNLTVNLALTGNTANFSGNIFAPAIVQNTSTYDTRISLSSAAGIVEVSANGFATKFLPSGQVELGGAAQVISGTFGGSGITLGASQTDLFQNRGGNVTIQVGTGGTIANTWNFNNNGNTSFPAAGAVNLGNLANVNNLVANTLTANTAQFNGNVNVAGTLVTQNIIPAANVTYDLGSPTARFRDLYLSGSTLDVGGTLISGVDGELRSNTFNAAVSFVSGGLNVLNQANTARTQANTAYGQANAAYGTANAAYGQANAAYGQANAAYGQANTARTTANDAYGQAKIKQNSDLASK